MARNELAVGCAGFEAGSFYYFDGGSGESDYFYLADCTVGEDFNVELDDALFVTA